MISNFFCIKQVKGRGEGEECICVYTQIHVHTHTYTFVYTQHTYRVVLRLSYDMIKVWGAVPDI